MAKELQPIRHDVPQELLTSEIFLQNFWYFLPRYIASGSPSEDTLRVYTNRIYLFFNWCKEQKVYPLALGDYEIRGYREFLLASGDKPSTVHAALAAVRVFYKAAEKLGFVKENPARDVSVSVPPANDMLFHYFNQEQLKAINEAINREDDPLARSRNHLMLYLMAVEGLRSVEVERANVEDINWKTRTMLIRGKGMRGRLDPIFPCEKTFERLEEYLSHCPPKETIKKDGNLTPLILATSNRNRFGRLGRAGIRYTMTKILKACGLKEDGLATHILRHSCGTNLYAATKDLRIVQETLRQRDPKTTARYAHVQERLQNRVTEKITF